MTEPYLILHKVRGEPAFDIAIQMECPICKDRWEHEDWICGECNGDKYWWIIPTSGHRAYPYWSVTIDYDHMGYLYIEGSCISHEIPELPEDIPDHYQYSIDRSATLSKTPIQSLDVQAALAKLIPSQPTYRRKL